MTTTAQDFTMYAGDTNTITVTVTDSAGAVVNITGATITWKLLEEQGGTIALTKTVGSGIIITNGAGGIFTIALAATDTASLLAGAYYHEAELTDTSSNVSTILIGTLTLKESI